jgi:hypothetical protein
VSQISFVTRLNFQKGEKFWKAVVLAKADPLNNSRCVKGEKTMTPKRNLVTVVTSLMVAGAILVTNTAEAATRAEVKRMVVEEARDSSVPTALALAVAKVESNFDERALSSAGARGVMQIMPATARNVFGITKNELWNARLNVQLGIDYLEQLYEQYAGRWELALSHYNGGTLKGGRGANARPHDYTRRYVADVMKWHARFNEQAQIWQVAGDPTDMDDLNGWPQSSGKAIDVISDDWKTPAPNSSKPIRKRVARIIVRRIPDRGRVKEDEGEALSVIGSGSLTERLRRARRALDDFASDTALIRWYEG